MRYRYCNYDTLKAMLPILHCSLFLSQEAKSQQHAKPANFITIS